MVLAVELDVVVARSVSVSLCWALDVPLNGNASRIIALMAFAAMRHASTYATTVIAMETVAPRRPAKTHVDNVPSTKLAMASDNVRYYLDIHALRTMNA